MKTGGATISVGITGTGFYVPEKKLTNFDIERMVDTTDEWIRTRTGIEERRVAADDQATSDLATEAARQALEDAQIDPGDVDLIIVATLSPDHLFPSTACLVQSGLGIEEACAFDLGASCSGFIYALSVAESLLKTGKYQTALVIGAEIFSKILDWRDRDTCVLFGDGAGAVVLKKVDDGKGILSFHLSADGSGSELLKQPAGGSRLPASHDSVNQRLHTIRMKGRDVYKFATRKMPEAGMQALKRAGLTVEDIDLIIPHQANIRILEYIAHKFNLPREKVYINLNRYGNTSAASIPIALCEAIAEGRVKEDNIILLVAFGAGLTWAASVIRWQG